MISLASRIIFTGNAIVNEKRQQKRGLIFFMTRFVFEIKKRFSMQQVAEAFGEERKLLFEVKTPSSFAVKVKSFASGKNMPLMPMAKGTLNYSNLETNIVFKIKILNLWGWIVLTLIALCFFGNTFGKGLLPILVPWIFNVSYYLFKRSFLIQTINSTLERLNKDTKGNIMIPKSETQ